MLMQSNTSNIWILNPDYKFKNDYDRIAIYSIRQVQPYSSSNWVSYIHPLQAFILNSFNDIMSLPEHYENLSNTFKISYKDAERMISPYIENEGPIYTLWKGEKIAFPKNVLIPADKISDLSIIKKKDIPSLDTSEIDLTPDRMHKGPQSLLFMLTNKCVTNCKYCYADRKTKYTPLTTDEIFKIIDDARSLDMAYIDVIGGELFCKKDWYLILKKLVDENLTPNYISTKVPLDEQKIKQLYETGYNNVIQISLDVLDDYILNKIIGTNIGYVEKMKRTIQLLVEYGFKIQIDTILTKYNTETKHILDLFNYINTIPNLAYWEIRIPEMSIYNQKEFHEVKCDRHTLENLRKYVNDEIKPKAEIPIIFSDDVLQDKYKKGNPEDENFIGGSCGFLKNNLFVLPDGKVSVCEQLYWHPQFIIGDLRRQSLCDVWNSDKAQALFNLKSELIYGNGACKRCNAIELCKKRHHKCFVKIIKAYGEDKWNYPDPRCINAPKVHSDLVY